MNKLWPPVDSPRVAPFVRTVAAKDENEPDIVVGTREQLFHLLAEASEIEHTLMCSYLFAAFSLRAGDEPGFSAGESAAIKRWRKGIMRVAIEEMGHLLIVANLTAAVGGKPHFTRPNFPVTPGYFPSGVALALSPFSASTIDHFIFLERPTGTEGEDGEGFEPGTVARVQAHLGLMPSVQDYATVSHLYEAIRANLRTLARRSGERGLFIGHARGQLGRDLIDMPGIEAIATLEAAERALDLIVEQGEGGTGCGDHCHYQIFSGIRRELGDLVAINPEFEPAFPVTESPVMRHSADMEGKTFVSARAAAQVLDFCNAAYGLLLRLLVQAYTKSDEEEAHARKTMVEAAFELMHVLGGSARFLASLPVNDETPHLNAGMTFTMLRGVEPFLSGRPEAYIITERLGELSAGASLVLQNVPDFPDYGPTLGHLAKRFQSDVVFPGLNDA